MIFAKNLHCFALFGLVTRVAAIPTPEVIPRASCPTRCSTVEIVWPWATNDAIQDVINVEKANIKLKLSPAVKAFSLMLAQISPGYILNDTLTGDMVWARDDYVFRKPMSFHMELFRVQNECGISFDITKTDFMDKNRKPQDLTIAPMVYEQWYKTLRAIFPHRFWCKGDEKTCLFADTQVFFSHATHLQLKQANVGSLSGDALQKVLDGVANKSPVMLATAESVAIITAVDKTTGSWTGFDISAPKTIRTWTKGETQKWLVAYAESHEPLPLNTSQNPCPSPAHAKK